MAEIGVGNVVTIASIVLQIKDVADKVRRNKKDCSEIAKFVARNSALLKRLEEGTKITQDEVMCKTMEAVTENLNETLRLVTECQKKNFLSRLFQAGDMATDLSRVRTNLVENMIQASLATNIHGNILLEIVAAAAPRLQPQVSFRRVPSTSGRPERHQVTRQTSGEVSSEAQVGHSSNGGNSTAYARSMPSNLSEVNEEEEEETMTSIGSQSPTSSSLGHIGFRQFSLPELKAATHGFSEDMKVGSGGYSHVYKGVLHNESLVAIKAFNEEYNLLREELNILVRLEHKNVVKLVGYCIDVKYEFFLYNGQYVEAESRQDYLVLGYVPNGHLQMIINGTTRIDWSTCFLIIQGIVQGLHYLHQQRVIHMDVKPSNICFDSEMNPVIIDFGLSIVLDENKDEVTLEKNAGTVGHMAPEQLDKGTASTKSDVYSFGITLCKTIASVCIGSQEYWKTMLSDGDGRVVESLDPTLQVDGSQLMEIKRCEVVALLCIQMDPRERPTMGDVLQMLKGEKELPTPKKPYP